ncbi:hypothetical protein NDU88_002728 [Pleurodeles waltl]|uniref:Uncharacterized protein n=1 Tax=Pleurodeles waltl TaxID=8319 RepID=A0AAV7WM10_PLEWA|nr:hypothetical protein NDU88_002728 [Pleurodeles waltl]
MDTTESSLLEWDVFKVVLRGQCILEAVGIQQMLLQETLEAEETLRLTEKCHSGHPELQPELLVACKVVATKVEPLQCFDYCNYTIGAHVERELAGLLLAWLANPAKRRSVIDDRRWLQVVSSG